MSDDKREPTGSEPPPDRGPERQRRLDRIALGVDTARVVVDIIKIWGWPGGG
ncbi:MAG: hypothetical protein ACRCYX_13535 [Dermatophilaceae bacterium]